LSKALDEALKEYQQSGNIEAGADIIAKAFANHKDASDSNIHSESIKDSIQQGIDMAKPYVQGVVGAISSPGDLIKLFNPKVFVKVVQKLSSDYVDNISNTVNKAKQGELGIKNYIIKNPKTAAISVGIEVICYNLLIYGLKKYEEKYADPGQEKYFKSQRGELEREAKNANKAGILSGPTPKQMADFASKSIENLGHHTQYYAGG